MPKICISYRRSDSEGITGRIFDRLVAHYGKDSVFRDIDSVPAGTDFREHVKRVLAETNVLLAVVGPKWAGTRKGGQTRISDETDLVRIEVASALQSGTLVIPVLIGETKMPTEQLPPALKDFAFRNALRLDPGVDFDQHMQRLIRSIDARVGDNSKPLPDAAPAPRETTAIAAAAASDNAQKLGVRHSAPATEAGAERPVAAKPKSRLAGRAFLGAVAIVLIVGGVFYWHAQSIERLQAAAAQQAAAEAAQRLELEEQLARERGITPSDIKRLGDATVYLNNEWYLHDRLTRRQVYQRMVQIDGETLPCLVKMDDGSIVRWLTLDDQGGLNRPIGVAQTGSGFVISEQGFLITNKRFAAGWMLPYQDGSANALARAAIYLNAKSDLRPTVGDAKDIDNDSAIAPWVPGNGGYLFEASRPSPVSSGPRQFYGQNELLTVQFPGTRLNIAASAQRTAADVDLAVVKIDTALAVSKLELADDDEASIQVGQKVIMLGYKPILKPTVFADGDQTITAIVPEPTVIEAVVSRLPRRRTTEYLYQFDGLPVAGTAGGPVLSTTSGKVVAILTMPESNANGVVAIPVSYLRELLQPQRNAAP